MVMPIKLPRTCVPMFASNVLIGFALTLPPTGGLCPLALVLPPGLAGGMTIELVQVRVAGTFRVGMTVQDARLQARS